MAVSNFNTKNAAILSIFYFFHFGSLGVFIPFSALYLKYAGFDGTKIGILLSVIPLTKFLFTDLWTKTYGKRLNKKMFVVVNLLISNLILFMLLTPSFIMVFITFFIYAITRVGVLPVIDNITNEFSLKSNREYGRIRLFGSIGFIVFTTIMGILAKNISINSFIFLGIFVGVLGAISIIPTDLIKNGSKEISKISSIKLSSDFKIIMISAIFTYVNLTFFHNFFNVKFDIAGISQIYAGVAWSVGILAEIALMYYAKNIFSKFGFFELLILANVAGIVRSAVICFSSTASVLISINILHGLAFGGFHLAIIKYIQSSIEIDVKLKAQSVYAAYIYGFSTILGSVISGFLYDILNLNLMFLSGIFFPLVSILILLLFKKNFLVKYKI